MRTREEFLRFVLPTSGNYCLWVCKGKGDDVRQELFTSIEQLLNKVDFWVERKYNVFFGLASYQTLANRTQENTESMKSFFLDIDAGPNKKNAYPTTEDAMIALRAFVQKIGFPKPNIIKSGHGLHVYWVFEEEIPTSEWKPYAEGFKKLCDESGLIIDPAVPADSARVLRVPYTFHVKDANNPIEAVPLIEAPAVTLESLKSLLPAVQPSIWDNIPKFAKMDETTRALAGNFTHVFKNILIKSVQGEGCAQLAYIYEKQEEVPEPLWRAGLSIAIHCEDGEKAIHKISEKHPEYNREMTEAKAHATKGPYTCETFKKLNPELCAECPHKITSPILLDSTMKEADPDAVIQQYDPQTDEIVEYPVPELPFPYFRGAHGGIYRKPRGTDTEDGEEELEPVLICSRDFYVVQRIHDPEYGESVLLRLHLPKDGVREFLAPLADVLSRDKFKTIIGKNGIPARDKQVNEIMGYVTRCVEHLQNTVKSAVGKTQMGWQGNNTSFVIGDREIFADRIEYSPPSSPILGLVPKFKKAGNFHEWKDVVNSYRDPEYVQRAYVFFHAFGTPLMRFMKNTKGFVVCAYGKGSGTGKTTVLQAVASAYGDPDLLLMNAESTPNSVANRLGTLQNMPVTVDEITEMDAMTKAKMIYGSTYGIGKERMESGRNVERVNNITWQSCMLTSSNMAVDQEILSIKSAPEGILNRLLCLKAYDDKKTDPAIARNNFNRLFKNYGHAMEIYMQYVMANLPEVIKLLDEVQARLEAAAQILSTERFWGNDAAVTITGGIIAKRLGIHDIPISPVFKYIVEEIKIKRQEKKNFIMDDEDILSSYMYDNINRMVIANGMSGRTGIDAAAILSPRGNDLVMRFEPDTKLLFVSVSDLRVYCTKKAFNLVEALLPHEKSKCLLGMKHKRLGSGTQYATLPAIRAYCFDVNKLANFNEEALRANATGTESSDTD